MSYVKHFKSNCYVEAFKAKRKNKNVKIIVLPPWKCHQLIPHVFWQDGDFVYDFGADDFGCYFWFDGYIRCVSAIAFYKLMRN